MQSIAFSCTPTRAARLVWSGHADSGAIGPPRCRASAAGAMQRTRAKTKTERIALRIKSASRHFRHRPVISSQTRNEERVPWTQRRKENARYGDESPEIRAGVARAAQ